MTLEEFKEWKPDKSLVAEQIYAANGAIAEIGKETFKRKITEIVINSTPFEEMVKKNPDIDVNELPMMQTRLPNKSIYIYTGMVIENLKMQIIGSKKRDLKTKRYISHLDPAIKFNDLHEGDIYRLIRSYMCECLIHEYYHINQYIRYNRNSYECKNYYTERPVLNITGCFVYTHLRQLFERMYFIPVFNVEFVVTASYYEKKLLAEKDKNLMNYIESLKSLELEKEEKKLRIKNYIANRCIRDQFYRGGGRYKRASLEYLLAADVVYGTNLNIDNINNSKIDETINEMRRNIRSASYFEWDGVVWKENGKYVYYENAWKKGD